MNKLSTTLFSLIFSVFLVGQDYHPFLEDQKFWTVESVDYIDFDLDPTISQWSHSYLGDTLIDGIEYKDYGVILREDTITQQVFKYDVNYIGNECMVYDFSVEPGDTIHTCNFSLVIDSVSTYELLNGETRKIVHYVAINDSYYIEGIGSLNGFIFLSNPIGYPSYELMCVRKDGVDLYGDRCDEVVSLNELVWTPSVVELFPNPSQSWIELSGATKIEKVEFLDQKGEIVLVKHGDFSRLGIAHLTQGLYVIRITTETGVEIKKLIKG